jgi:hypothetical protein
MTISKANITKPKKRKNKALTIITIRLMNLLRAICTSTDRSSKRVWAIDTPVAARFLIDESKFS